MALTNYVFKHRYHCKICGVYVVHYSGSKWCLKCRPAAYAAAQKIAHKKHDEKRKRKEKNARTTSVA
jgi:hypothetical protein